MAGTLQKVRFKRPWQTYVVGEEITPNGTLRDWLVGNGYVEIIGGAGERRAKLSHKAAAKLAKGADASTDLLAGAGEAANTTQSEGQQS